MTLDDIKCCPCTLSEGYSTYSPTALKKLFNGKKVSHILQYDSVTKNEETAELFIENRKRISISGVQEKLSFILDGSILRLTKKEEQGTYILKPIPRDLKKVAQVPANEHLTMQIAKQVYDINVAENALVFFKDGTPAYLTKRFDVKSDNTKWGKEDFATLAQKTKDNAGVDFKYNYSYQELGLLIQKYVPSWKIEIEKFFTIIIFNFIFSNGDAHLKNFSLLETVNGDYVLSPFYDLICTKLHVDDTDFALKKGLFAAKKINTITQKTFLEFADCIGVSKKRAEAILSYFAESKPDITVLTNRSFLDDKSKHLYLTLYEKKLRRINV